MAHFGAPPVLASAVVLFCAAACFWSLASVVVSYWVYDRSGLYAWRWISDWFQKHDRSAGL